jgi:1-deoxy-D-xylulose-5-phosphate reductoisomerase
MIIPIFNSLYFNKKKIIRTDKINLKILNNLKFNEVDIKKFPSIKLIKKMPHKDSLYETVLVSANDELVNLFLHKKIKFLDIVRNLNKIISLKQFTKYKGIYPKNVNQILNLNDIVRLKIKSLSIISSS